MKYHVIDPVLAKSMGKVVSEVWASGRKKATHYLSPHFVIKATRRHKLDRRESREEFVVTVGAPNYLERIFVKQALKAKELFPIDKIQLR